MAYSPLPPLGSAVKAASLPVVIASDQTVPVSGTITASISGSAAVTGTFWQGTQPVSLAALPALATGGNVIGGVTQSGAWSVTVSGTTAISAASLPLPAGASTSAKQPALGIAGTASTDVLTVQGIASMTALKVDASATTQPVSGTVTANAGSGTFAVSGTFWQATQPVSGTVTANAGSGTFAISAASLPLPTGAAADATLTGGTAKAINRGGAKGTTTAADVTSTASGANHQPMDVAIYDASGNLKDPTAIRALTSSDQVTVANASLAVTGTFWQATQPVSGTVSVNALPTGSNVIGALTANQSVNVSQINGVTALMGNGVTGTGSPRVTIASDNTAFSVNPAQFVNSADTTMQSAATATGNGTVLPITGYGTALVQITGTFVGTVTFEGTEDGTNFVSVGATQLSTGAISATATTPDIYRLSVGGLASLRARISAYTSGSITALGRTTNAPYPTKYVIAAGNVASGATDSGNPVKVGGVYNSSPPLPSSGQRYDLQVNAYGTLKVALQDGTATNFAGTAPADALVNASYYGLATIGFNHVYNGTTWDRARGDTTAGSWVQLKAAIPTGSNVIGALTSNQSVNLAQLVGTATDVNSGVKSAGTLRVVLATDQPALTNKLLVTPDSVALPANQSTNVSQINAVTPLMGNGVTGTGSLRVTIASNNTAFTVNNTPTTPTASTISSAATTNATSIKASAGVLHSVSASNVGAAAAFLKLYNKASAPTVGTDVPVLTIPIAASGVVNLTFGATGMALGTGVALAITNLVADADTTAIAAAQVKVMTSYI